MATVFDLSACGANMRLSSGEAWWRDHCTWLDECGYTLRPRYRPDWKPSWGTDSIWLVHEDGHSFIRSNIMDAVRKSDGTVVMMKKTSKATHPHEVEIARFLSSEELSRDPRNRCCPFYDVLQVPENEDEIILVMPHLRWFHDPVFVTIGECVEFFRQIFEGVQFMHSHHVAHRDLMRLNIMMDASPMYPESYHPVATWRTRDFSGPAKHCTRTERPIRYYITDFGLSRRYSPEEHNPLEFPILGGDKTVPEFQENPAIARNPFHTDIYYLGSLIRQDFLMEYTNFGFMKPLLHDMLAEDPAARPTIDQVVERFNKLASKMAWWTLRSRLRPRRDHPLEAVARDLHHIYVTTLFLAKFRRSIPTPRSS